VCFSALAAAVSFQQAPRAITFRPADATLGEPFTSIYSIRELGDGHVLISDNGTETRLVVADLRGDAVRTLGRQGSGPGEYRQAGKLFALTHDSTLFMDGDRSRRWLVLVRDSIVRTLAPDDPTVGAVPGDVFGADSAGHLLGLRGGGATPLSGDISRLSNIAILASRRGGKPDTILKVRGYDQRVRFNPQRTFSVHSMLNGSAEEQVWLFQDGWIAIVHVEPYRVDWRAPNGTIRRGPDLLWEAPRSDATEKRAYDERQRRRRGERYRPDNDYPWAERLAPIRPGSLQTPEGFILVARSQWSRVPDSQYDLVDRTGAIVGRLALPDSERVIGFGARSAYVVVTDGDGFQRLRRHPWP
jgi:hypothetical protein